MSLACTVLKVEVATAAQSVSLTTLNPPATVSFHCESRSVSAQISSFILRRLALDLTPSATPVRVGTGAGKAAGVGWRGAEATSCWERACRSLESLSAWEVMSRW